MKTVGWTANPAWEADAFAAVYRHTGGTPRRINTLCSRLLQFGALDEQTAISAAMVDEVAEEMAEGLNEGEPAAVNGATHGAADTRPVASRRNGYTSLASGTGGEPIDLLHRIEALEEITARQDRVFQKILKLLTSAVERSP